MPPCQGRPDGPCPNNRDDSTVSWSLADIYLCKDCSDYRFGKVSDNTLSERHVNAVHNNKSSDMPVYTVNTELPVHNELLCFLHQRSKILAFDDLVNLSADFYTLEEVMKARGIISKFCKDRLPMHKCSDKAKAKKTVSDLLKIIIDPVVILPVFYAVNISRLPAAGIDHVDVAALFQELTMLRNEVRSFATLRPASSDDTAIMQELIALRSEVQSFSVIRSELFELKNDVRSLQATQSMFKADLCLLKADTKSSSTSNEPVQVLKTGSDVSHIEQPVTTVNAGDGVSWSRIVQSERGVASTGSVSQPDNNASTDHKKSQSSPKQQRRQKAVYGRASNDDHLNLKSVDACRSAHLFVSRVNTATIADDVIASVRSSLMKASGGSLDIREIKCDSLPTKFNSYNSFHVAVTVKHSSMSDVLTILNSADSWPCGVLVRRYFVNRNGS